jgi:CubicO group peptidase (beta-lactamase class C family)
VDDEREPLVFAADPGTPGYSGEGFEVLLQAVSAATGRPTDELLESLPSAFGMHSSAYTWRPDFDGHAAVPHLGGEALEKQRPRVPRAAGTLHTTLDDYAAFAIAALTRDRLGWLVDELVVWQYGSNLGFRHLVALEPAAGRGVVVLTNEDEGQDQCRQACRKILGSSPW